MLDETERAIETMLRERGIENATARAARSRRNMETAFEDAMVSDFDAYLPTCAGLPDPGDAHILAAALKTGAFTIVTENLRDFPANVLAPLHVEARSTDEFLADTISLDLGRAVAVIRRMRRRFKKPELDAEALLVRMEAERLTQTVDALRPRVESL